ncbi:hypothetical protein Tco_0717994 [Tanacetum coccineum]
MLKNNGLASSAKAIRQDAKNAIYFISVRTVLIMLAKRSRQINLRGDSDTMKKRRNGVRSSQQLSLSSMEPKSSKSVSEDISNEGHPQKEDQCYVDSGCSRHMTGNMSYLSDFKEFDGGYVTFGGGAKGGKITGKGTLKTADESQVLLKVPRKNNMYSVDHRRQYVPKESINLSLVAKAPL